MSPLTTLLCALMKADEARLRAFDPEKVAAHYGLPTAWVREYWTREKQFRGVR